MKQHGTLSLGTSAGLVILGLGLAASSCATVLGIDKDYHPLDGSGGAGTASSSGGGGASGTGTSSGSGGAAGMTTSSSTGPGACQPADCQGNIYQCGDTLDNDSDGLIDSQDPDCLGPCDNTENNYYGGIPGQAGPGCAVDCYFDQDAGSGNDVCYWDHRCDPLEVTPDYYPEWWRGTKCGYDINYQPVGGQDCTSLSTNQSATCLGFCGPLVPNGCDCFGCCELPAGTGRYVYLGTEDVAGNGTCSIADIGDKQKCAPCTPVQACLNTCEACEICIGRPEPDPTCDPATSQQCSAGVQPCGLPGQACCASGYYCVSGCCQPTPPAPI